MRTSTTALIAIFSVVSASSGGWIDFDNFQLVSTMTKCNKAGSTVCPLKAGDSATLTADIVVDGGVRNLAIKSLNITLIWNENNEESVDHIATCVLPSGNVGKLTISNKCANQQVPPGKYSLQPFTVTIPKSLAAGEATLIAFADVQWSKKRFEPDINVGYVTVNIAAP